MRRLLPWIILGLILRIFLITTTIHPDIRGYNIAAFLISQKGELWTFYDHMRILPQKDPLRKLYGDDIFIYPPLPYLTLATFMKLFGPLYPWNIFQILIHDYGQVIGNPQLPWLLFLLKSPYLFIDLFGLFLITNLTPEKEKKFILGLLWIFNPITLYSAYMVSQFDILISVLLLASLVSYQKKRKGIALVFLGLSAAVKQFPLFLLPFFALNSSDSFKERFKLFSIGLVSYLAVITPYLFSVGFRQYALLASQADKIFYAKIAISGAFSIPIFLLVYFVSLWFCYWKRNGLELWEWLLFPFLSFYSLVHFHPQWFTWVSPLLCLLIVKREKFFFPVLVTIALYVVMVILFEPSLNTELFSPLLGYWYSFSVFEAVSRFYSPALIGDIVRSLFAATNTFILARLTANKS